MGKNLRFKKKGAHLVEEAAKAQMKFEALLITDESQLDKRWNMDKRHVYHHSAHKQRQGVACSYHNWHAPRHYNHQS